MGIKSFFSWFKQNYEPYIYRVQKGTTIPFDLDNLLIDLNGIFHTSAQKVYKYGNFKPKPRMLGGSNQKPFVPPRQNTTNDIKVYEDSCATIEKLVNMTRPKKRLILTIDGTAPKSKAMQQKSRRFRAVKEALDKQVSDENIINTFNSNCISPGTKFMDRLSRYIDWFIRKKISENPDWQHLEVIFSSEKVPGEGEHTCINYIRNHGNPSESFCVSALDADLIMLTLGCTFKFPNMYILREDVFGMGKGYNMENDYFYINIGAAKYHLVENMRWESEEFKYNEEYAINDFIFLCFMVGNDFLPHVPSIEILDDGIEIMLQVYKEVCPSYGHITRRVNDINNNTTIKFNKKAVEILLGTIGNYEKTLFETKLRAGDTFPDNLMLSCATQNTDCSYDIDIEKYITMYCDSKFNTKNIEKVCHDYLEGMQWVLTYYTKGISNWNWCYSQYYAPMASVLAKYVSSFTFKIYGKTQPNTPFQQLLTILPPQSANLLPSPLDTLLTDSESPLAPYCPLDFEIDLSGKRKEWEGVVILPIVDFNIVRKEYEKLLASVDEKELKLNSFGKSIKYKYNIGRSYLYRSFYGDIECKASYELFDI